MKVKEESEKSGLKLKIQKIKSWHPVQFLHHGNRWGISDRLYFCRKICFKPGLEKRCVEINYQSAEQDATRAQVVFTHYTIQDIDIQMRRDILK